MRHKNVLSALFAVIGFIWLFAKPIGQAVFWIAALIGAKDDLKSLLCLLRNMDKTSMINNLGPWLLVVGGIASLIWINFGTNIRKLFKVTISNDELASKCEEIAKEITDFIFERESQAPPIFPPFAVRNIELQKEKNYDQFLLESNYKNQTTSLYKKNIGPKVYDLYSLLVENGHRPDTIIVFGDDHFAHIARGRLTAYARQIRQGEKIVDDKMKARYV